MASLDGAEDEVKNINSTLSKETFIKDIQYTNMANISWVMDNLKKSSYEIIYFATHSMPYSETYSTWHIKYNTLVNHYKKNFNKIDWNGKKFATTAEEAEQIMIKQKSVIEKELPSMSFLK